MATPRGSNSNSGSNTPRGPRRANFDKISSSNSGVYNTFGSQLGLGRGPRRGDESRGRGGSKLRPDAPLSALLLQERPLLRPIKFVPSVHTKVLFQEEEEIFQAVVEEVGKPWFSILYRFYPNMPMF